MPGIPATREAKAAQASWQDSNTKGNTKERACSAAPWDESSVLSKTKQAAQKRALNVTTPRASLPPGLPTLEQVNPHTPDRHTQWHSRQEEASAPPPHSTAKAGDCKQAVTQTDVTKSTQKHMKPNRLCQFYSYCPGWRNSS